MAGCIIGVAAQVILAFLPRPPRHQSERIDTEAIGPPALTSGPAIVLGPRSEGLSWPRESCIRGAIKREWELPASRDGSGSMTTFYFDLHSGVGIEAARRLALEMLGQTILDDAARHAGWVSKVEVRDRRSLMLRVSAARFRTIGAAAATSHIACHPASQPFG